MDGQIFDSEQTKKRIYGGMVLVLGVLLFFGVRYLRAYFAVQKQPLKSGEVLVNRAIESSVISSPVSFEAEMVVSDLFVPWAIVFTSESRMLVTERSGSIREVRSGDLQVTPLIHFDEVSTKSEEGLMGMDKDPDYDRNHFLYVCMAYEEDGELYDKVLQLEDRGDDIARIRTLVDQIPAAQFHAGCRVRFGPDGRLYVTTGDATTKNIAQDKESLGGKILRIKADGNVPEDNPVPGSYVYSLGHRNPQGIAWDSEGRMYETEHGPSGFDGPLGGDEINLIEPGVNYGWPIVSHEKTDPRFASPLDVFTPAEAPSGLLYYSGEALPQYTGSFLFGVLKGEGLIHVEFDEGNPREIVKLEKLELEVGRIREVVQGPDELIYFTTSNRDGRGTVLEGDDKIYRLRPE